MKRQKNYRQLRNKSSARNRLSEIKSRVVAPDINHSDATVNEANNNLFGEKAERTANSEFPEDRFENTPLPEFPFDWDEEFFGTTSPGNNGMTETNPFEIPAVEEEPAETETAEVKQETGPEMQEEITAVNIPELVEPAPAAVETEPEPEKPVTFVEAPARFVSVKRKMAKEKREAEKMRTPEAAKPAGKQGGFSNTVLKKADSPAVKKVRSVAYGLPAKFGQSTAINKVERAVAGIQKPSTGISGVGKKSEAPSLYVRRAPSFRSFVVATINRLMEQQRFLASEPESSRFLARELGVDMWSEGQGAMGEEQRAESREQRVEQNSIQTRSHGTSGRQSPAAGIRQPGARSQWQRGTDNGRNNLNRERFALMEAMINAKALYSNMRIRW